MMPGLPSKPAYWPWPGIASRASVGNSRAHSIAQALREKPRPLGRSEAFLPLLSLMSTHGNKFPSVFQHSVVYFSRICLDELFYSAEREIL